MLRRKSQSQQVGSLNHNHFRKQDSSVLKHKVRNLRAKLKNMLSIETCSKLNKRQKIVNKMAFHVHEQYLRSTQGQWDRSKQPLKQFYSCRRKQNMNMNASCMSIFSQLSREQIEQVSLQVIHQIKQDKIYYLGQENVQKFEEFLTCSKKFRSPSTNNANSPNNKMIPATTKTICNNKKSALSSTMQPSTNLFKGSSSNSNIINTLQMISKGDLTDVVKTTLSSSKNFISQLSPQPMLKRQCTQNNSISGGINNIHDSKLNLRLSQQCSAQTSWRKLQTAKIINQRQGKSQQSVSYTKRSQPSFKGMSKISKHTQYLGNREHFLQKRRQIEEEENAHRIITKLSIKMKQDKALKLVRHNQSSIFNAIKQRNHETDQKARRMLQERNKRHVTFGSIVELNEELRKIYIKNISSLSGGSSNNSGQNS